MGLALREQARAVQLLARAMLAIGRLEDAIRPTRSELAGVVPSDVEMRESFEKINASIAELVMLRVELRSFIQHEGERIEACGPLNATRVGRPR